MLPGADSIGRQDVFRFQRVSLGLAAMVLFAASGCVTTQNVTTTQALPSSSADGIAVIGLSGGARILFWSGEYRDGVFKPDGWFPRGLSLAGGQPYLVEKVRATNQAHRYGFESITLGRDTIGIGCNQPVPVLGVRNGAVQYFGDFSVARRGGRIWVRRTFDMARAQAYLNKTYPARHWTLQVGDYSTGRTMPCLGYGYRVPIIIFIPVRR